MKHRIEFVKFRVRVRVPVSTSQVTTLHQDREAVFGSERVGLGVMPSELGESI